MLLPLPLLVFYWMKPLPYSALRLTYLPDAVLTRSPYAHLNLSLVIVIWLAFVLACARPTWYGEPVVAYPEHRDMMLVVDLSYSMNEQDMRIGDRFVDRLTAVKQVISDFVAKRQGDRLGLVFFADHAYLQTPLTLDHSTLITQLNQAVLRLIGTQTAIGDGIGLATKTFVDSQAPQRIMVLLSDGSNNAGVLEPLEAAQIAQHFGTKIYTIGVGAGEMLVKDFLITRRINTAEDLDEATLEDVAKLTGGRYFRARDQQQLQEIYDEIDKLEPIQQTPQLWRPQKELFAYPLALALLLSIGLVLIRKPHV